jgi:hypothetical protein
MLLITPLLAGFRLIARYSATAIPLSECLRDNWRLPRALSDGSISIHRIEKPHIDASGFESYSFKCGTCGSMVVGIIDLVDDALLLTVAS